MAIFLLLSVTPLLDETSFNTTTNVNYMESTLLKCEKLRYDRIFIVGDNVSTNKSITNAIDCPMIGCAKQFFLSSTCH